MKLYIPDFVLFKAAQGEDPLAAAVDAANAANPVPDPAAATEAAEPVALEGIGAEEPSVDPVEELRSVLTGLLGEDTSSEEQELNALEKESEETTND